LLAGWQAWDSHKQQMAEVQSAANAEAKEINDEVRSLLTYLSAPERQNASFDPSVDATVNLLTSEIGNTTLSDQQIKTMQDLANLLSPICARTQDATLLTQCDYDLFVLTNTGHETTSAWDNAMANYKGWRDPAAVAFVTNENGTSDMSFGLPKAIPPAVEPAPVSVTSMASAPPPPAPAPASPPPPAPVDPAKLRSDVIAACGQNGQTFMLYTQIYDDSQRADVLRSLAPVRELGIVVPGVENVTDTAKRNGRHGPFEWKSPTVLYAPDGKTCATALVKWGNATLPALSNAPAKAVALPAGTGTSNVLELWIPRRRSVGP
jgi:hypothetical protein